MENEKSKKENILLTLKIASAEGKELLRKPNSLPWEILRKHKNMQAHIPLVMRAMALSYISSLEKFQLN